MADILMPNGRLSWISFIGVKQDARDATWRNVTGLRTCIQACDGPLTWILPDSNGRPAVNRGNVAALIGDIA